jgi:hypothetical protein
VGEAMPTEISARGKCVKLESDMNSMHLNIALEQKFEDTSYPTNTIERETAKETIKNKKCKGGELIRKLKLSSQGNRRAITKKDKSTNHKS